MNLPPAPHTLRLPDGRILAWAEYGRADGPPVVYCHGWPGSRLEAAHGHDSAAAFGVRLIAPDRPGIGLSDFQSGRRIADFARDVEALAASLRLERFGLLGVSGGAPYALACAALLPERVTRLAIACGLGPLDTPGIERHLDARVKLAFTLARRSQTGLRALGAAFSWVVHRHPLHAVSMLTQRLCDSDRSVLADPHFVARQLAAWREAFRSGTRGPGGEGHLYARPWDLPIHSIRVPVRLWHGEADTTVPIAMARHMASIIPGCRGEFVPGEGHFSLPLRFAGTALQFVAGSP